MATDNYFSSAGFGGTAGAAGGLIGGILSIQAAKKAAKVQREWQEKMRSTAYQATMTDMQAAGLNPMLAYSKGPTAGGQAQMARISDLGSAITGGMRAGADISAKNRPRP